MSELDKKIREALQAQDRELFDEYSGEQGLFEMVAETFQTRHRWLVLLVWFWMLVFFVMSIITAVQFFRAESTRDLIAWAVGFLFFMLGTSLLKTWYWMEMNKNSITREIKRVELQIARLAERIRDQ